MMKKTLPWQKKFAFVVTQSWDVWEKQQLRGVCLHGPRVFSLETADFHIPEHLLLI